MKTRILLSALFLTTSFTATSNAMITKNDEPKDETVTPVKNSDVKTEKKEETKEEKKKRMHKNWGNWANTPEENLKEETQRLEKKTQEIDKFEKKNTAEQIKIFSDFLNEAKIGKKTHYDIDIYTDIARKTIVRLADLDKLTSEQRELFKLALIFANEYSHTLFILMPKVQIRAEQLFPEYKLSTVIRMKRNDPEDYVKNYGTVLNLTSEEEKKIRG